MVALSFSEVLEEIVVGLEGHLPIPMPLALRVYLTQFGGCTHDVSLLGRDSASLGTILQGVSMSMGLRNRSSSDKTVNLQEISC